MCKAYKLNIAVITTMIVQNTTCSEIWIILNVFYMYFGLIDKIARYFTFKLTFH